ncbi:MAG TPA: winged helix-turn-helix domain-containing protein [Pyrinomonadaceae bacterium]|nr:winged helix-turn-helix domain-containing protein [Pyrinomonadaceae bacterium]
MQNGRIYSFDQFQLDVENRRLLREDTPVSLSAKAFDLLHVLLENHGRLVEKDELFNSVWRDQIVEESNLTVHISQIRKALGENKNKPRYIETVPGYGYRFVGELQDADEELVIETHTVSRLTIEEASEAPDARLSLPTATIWNYKWLAVAVVAVLGAVAGIWFWGKSTSTSGARPGETGAVRSIAVLPFQFVNGETRNDGLELGLTESLINRLSGLKNISIRPITAVKGYATGNRDLSGIANELKVDSILEGNIQQEGNRIRLTVRLLNAEDGTTIWNERIDEDFADIFAVQDKISNRVANSLQLALNEKEKTQLAKVYTRNIEAYKKYLVARHNWNKRTPEGFAASIRSFNQAIDLDPTFALAFAGLADSYLLIGLYGIEPTTDAFPKARAAAEKALAIDQDLAEAYVSAAMVENLFQYDWNKAEEHFRRAIELRPNYSTGHHWFGLFLAMQGRTDEALKHISLAKDLDPLSPSINADLAFAFYLAGQTERSIEQLNKTLKLDAEFANTHNLMGMNYVAEKRFGAAIEEFENASRISGGNVGSSELVWATGFSGDKDKTRKMLAELQIQKKPSPFDLAIIFTSLGDKEQAIEYLYQAYEKRDPQIVPIKVFPPFESLAGETKFKELLTKMDL